MLTSLRTWFFVAAIGLTGAVDSEASAWQKAREHTFTGTIVAVHHEKGKHHGTITLKHHHKNSADTETKVLHVNEKTQVHHGKNSVPSSKLHKGLHVVVHYHNHHADRVRIVEKGHGK